MAHGRVRDQRTFRAFRRARGRGRSGPVSVTAVLDPDGQTIGGPPRSGPDVAFAIGRHVGSAVLRNRIRRRLRPIVASLELPDGAYLLTASAEAADLRFDDLRGHVEQAAAAAIARGDTP